jgi:Tol biopolymer transport system component
MGAHVAQSTADFSSYRYTPFATDAGIQGSPTWSPDGKTIAYVAEVEGVLQVFTRSLASSMREQLTRLRFDARAPFWSPDGTRIYFHSLARDKEALWSISPAGGQPELVVEGAARAAISPDGQRLAVLRDESISDVRLTLWFSSPPGAEPKRYTRPPFDKENFGSLMRFSPDGSRLLIWSDYGILKGFWMIQLPESDPRRVLPSLQGPRAGLEFTWLPDSRHVVVVRNDGPTSGTHLWLADVVTDTSRPLTITNGNEGSPAVSPDGSRIAFTSEATDFDLVLVPLDGSPPRSFLSSTRNELDPAWSPTAAQYAFVTDRTGSQEIWIRSEQDNWERALVRDSDFGGSSSTLLFSSLVFSPDGRRLAYQRFERDERGRIWISTLAGGPPIPLLESGVSYQDAPTWSPDGTWVAFVSTITPDRWSLAKARVGGGGAALVVLKEEILPQSRPHWSPDGRWILCQTTEGLVLVHPNGKESRVLSEQEWLSYEWAADARRVYGLRLSDDQTRLMLVMLDVGTLKEQVVNADVGFLPIAQQPVRGFSRVRDTAFLTSIARPRSDIWLLDGFSPPAGLLARFWPWRTGTLD